MKKFILIVLIACALFVAHNAGFDLIPDGVDRSTTWSYGTDLPSYSLVYVDFENGFAYHDGKKCYDTSKIKQESPTTEISEYEAIKRGFFSCPYCMDDGYDMYGLESTVDDIKYNVDALMSALGL